MNNHNADPRNGAQRGAGFEDNSASRGDTPAGSSGGCSGQSAACCLNDRAAPTGSLRCEGRRRLGRGNPRCRLSKVCASPTSNGRIRERRSAIDPRCLPTAGADRDSSSDVCGSQRTSPIASARREDTLSEDSCSAAAMRTPTRESHATDCPIWRAIASASNTHDLSHIRVSVVQHR
jgi:hypothetical protein